MDQNQVAQAVAGALGTKLPDGTVVQGMHVDSKALVGIFATGDAKTVETTRVERFARFLENAPAKELDDALRGPTADEKKANQKLPPFVRDAIEAGMQESSARARLTEMRKIRDAFTSGLKIDRERGWSGVFEDAKRTLEQRNTMRKSDAMAQDWGESLAKARQQMGIPLFDEKGKAIMLDDQQMQRQQLIAQAIHEQKHSKAAEMERAQALIKEADRYLESGNAFAQYGPDFPFQLAMKILDRMGFDVEVEKRKPQDNAAPAGTVTQGAQAPQGADTAQGEQQPAAQTQAA